MTRLAATCAAAALMVGLGLACSNGTGDDGDDDGCLGPACEQQDDCGNDTLDDGEQCDGTALAGATCIDLGYLSGEIGCADDCRYNTLGCFGTTTFCGDGRAGGDLGEQCDGVDLAGESCESLGFDGGELSCSLLCRYDTGACEGSGPTCGDGVADGTEACDGLDLKGASCDDFPTLTGDGLECTAGCNLNTFTCEFEASSCGNDAAEGLEACDGTDLRGFGCGTFDFGEGVLVCDPDCGGFDFEGCDDLPECGNGRADGLDMCDGNDLRGATCTFLGLGFGFLECNPDCTYDTSGCSESSTCGDGNAELLEICDGADLRSASCSSLGLGSGTLGCESDCGSYDISGCSSVPFCGDDDAQATEQCDGTDLRGQTCEQQGWGTGTLACSTTCLFYDTSGCANPPACGNGIRDTFLEVCDGSDVGTADCSTFLLGNGALGCESDCLGYDFSGCDAAPSCGDGVREATEACDGSDLGNFTDCTDFGFTAGTSAVACLPTCAGYDLSGCGAHELCANGAIDVLAGEQCDGGNLGFATCEWLGFSAGTLGCNANCSLDVSGCTP